jgi:Flp pilus assembly protein TadD
LGLALSDAGRVERAEQCLRRAAELNPKDANIPVALGVALGRLGRCDEAVDVLRTAVSRDERNPWAHRNLGAMLLQAKQTAESIPHYQAATRLLPNDQIAWLGLADACRLAGRTQEAQDAYVTPSRSTRTASLRTKRVRAATCWRNPTSTGCGR